MADETRSWFASLPAADFPHLRALSGVVASGSSDERFDIGLEIILRGPASYAREPSGGADPDAGRASGAP
ncbi:TetR/AcrR family transcriptional regulator C-terminal domain-containing protein [Streptomyces tropicalis]|uniref:TetR/AcrR family transcriptional regulator C-terminal domain-containing protein n=1 Tax=Streptomyces tropicalis TaxID=3034234 RepID=A0ABT6A3Q2_9ACTN|nr:TetR/AcrR family transcriptional regulator C-terminal domain-containing protein [Streptomyces tropicalis]MDF3299276.1 TetR/AcrR family transcriptional regulator C-terminal domain-containing protein [Streptomyces tropicalis]